MFCLNHILQQLTLLIECNPDNPKAVLAVHKKVLCTLYNHLYFLQSTVAMNSNDNKKPFKCKKPFINYGFRKPMLQEPPSAAKRPNTNLDLTKPPPQLPSSNKNTPSLESILKGKVIKEFVPQAQKEQKTPKLAKVAYEPAKSKPSAPTPTPKPPMPVPRHPVQQQPRPTRQPQQQPYKQQPEIRPQLQPPRLLQFPLWNQQGQQGIPFHWIPPGEFYVPRQPLKPKIHKPTSPVNNKMTHFC